MIKLSNQSEIKPLAHKLFSNDWKKEPEPKLGNKPILGDRYTSKEFMSLEWEKMWTKVWQVAGLEQQLQNPGDFFTFEFGPESILCAKGEDQKIRCFYNVCQHRGNQLVQIDEGNLESFSCAYHAWKFGLDGKLNWVPDEEDFSQGSPCGKRNLIEIKSEVWQGFIFFNLDDNSKSLSDYLSPIMEHLEDYPISDMIRTHWVTVEGDWNWKCVQDNFNESYHTPYVHPALKYYAEEKYHACQFDMYESMHSRMLMPGFIPSESVINEEDKVIEMIAPHIEYWDMNAEDYRGRLLDIREDLQKQKRKLDKEKGYDFSKFKDTQLTDHYHYTIFPNMSFSVKPDGMQWLRGSPHPTDPTKCIFDYWYLTLFPKGVETYFSPSLGIETSIDTKVPHLQGHFSEVDVGPGISEDVAIWTSQQKGLSSRGYIGDYMPEQENRIRYFHENIDKYLFGNSGGDA